MFGGIWNTPTEQFYMLLIRMALIYNRLIQSIVDERTVSNFQRRLTLIAKNKYLQDDDHWDQISHSIDFLKPHLLRTE